MFVESLIEETEELLGKILLSDLINLWNEIFPEENISLKASKDYSEEVVEDLKNIIIDELKDTGLERLITIHNQVAEEQITEDDIYEEFNEYEEIDENGEYL